MSNVNTIGLILVMTACVLGVATVALAPTPVAGGLLALTVVTVLAGVQMLDYRPPNKM